MKKIISLVAVMILAVFLVSGCANNGNVDNKAESNIEETVENDDNKEGEAKEDEEIKEGILPGNKASDFTLLDREGNQISLSSLEGKTVFLNFWASWCGPCKYEMPHMQKVYEEYKDKDVVILAVNITASEKVGIDGVNSFLDENKYTFPVLFDKDGAVSNQYMVRSIPTTYLINKDGIIVNLVQGAMDEDMIKKQLEAAME